MNKHLNKAYLNATHIPINSDSKIIIMSDCHRGCGNSSDNFIKNKNIFIGALQHYYDKGFTYIEVGDGDEMWEVKDSNEIVREHLDVFLLLKRFYEDNRFYMIYGNHDMCKKNCKILKNCFYTHYDDVSGKRIKLLEGMDTYEAIVLDCKDNNEIFIVHGHQDDFLNDKAWKVSRFLVRYLWKTLELIGIKDPTSAAKNYKIKNSVEKKLTNWSRDKGKIIIAGHTHRPAFPKAGEALYFNDGSCIHPSGITGLEIYNNNISLVKWGLSVRNDGVLHVQKEVLEEPEEIERYFKKLKNQKNIS